MELRCGMTQRLPEEEVHHGDTESTERKQMNRRPQLQSSVLTLLATDETQIKHG
jgi:hypothetical protein